MSNTSSFLRIQLKATNVNFKIDLNLPIWTSKPILPSAIAER